MVKGFFLPPSKFLRRGLFYEVYMVAKQRQMVYSEIYTTTGQKTLLQVDPEHLVTVAVSAAASDTYSLEVAVAGGASPTRYTELASQTNDIIKVIDAPISAVGLNIATLNSTSLTFEVRTAPRGR